VFFTVLVFAKTNTLQGHQILFGLAEGHLPKLTPAHRGLDSFAKDNGLQRHPEFDWHFYDKTDRAFLFETPAQEKDQLPSHFNLQTDVVSITWHSFPQALRQISEGCQRNFLQLAVQYISSGGICDSLVAAEYDKNFLNGIKGALL